MAIKQPELNLIKNIWRIIKDNVEKRISNNVGELMKYMCEEWDKVTQRVINNLIKSMKSRCELILEKNGDRIPY